MHKRMWSAGLGALLSLANWSALALTPELAGLGALPGATVTRSLSQEIERASRNQRPYQFAVSTPLAASLEHGHWDALDAETLRWRMRVASPGARSLSLELSRFHLPANASFWFYDPQGGIVHGPYTRADHTPEGKLWTAAIAGDLGVIELHVPRASKDAVQLQLGAVHHGFRALLPMAKSAPGASGGCHIDAVCPLGDAWRDELRSVAHITVGGILLCTGQLVNNTLQNEDPLFLTANHCGIGWESSPSSVVFYWNYFNSGCRANTSGPRDTDGSLAQSQSGSTLLARDPATDMTLLRLNQLPPAQYNVYYAGWNASTDVPQAGVSIHHPSGDVKMVSAFTGGAQRTHTTIPPRIDAETWEVSWAAGSTEGGSSGGGLWDQNHLIVGWLSGGNASCDNPNGTDNYGRMELAWDNDPSPDRQLRAHLAPDGSNTIALAGKNASGGGGSGGGGDSSGEDSGGGALGITLLLPLMLARALRRRALAIVVMTAALFSATAAAKNPFASTNQINQNRIDMYKQQSDQSTRQFINGERMSKPAQPPQPAAPQRPAPAPPVMAPAQEPDEPADPDEPDVPEDPGDPGEPEDPENPDEPEEPEEPDEPEEEEEEEEEEEFEEEEFEEFEE
jgi:lysyl endopeptidase